MMKYGLTKEHMKEVESLIEELKTTRLVHCNMYILVEQLPVGVRMQIYYDRVHLCKYIECGEQVPRSKTFYNYFVKKFMRKLPKGFTFRFFNDCEKLWRIRSNFEYSYDKL